MPAENANATATATANGNDARTGIEIGPGGIGGIDTEAADLDLLNRLVRENNQDDTGTGEDGDGDGDGGEDGGIGSDAGNEKGGEKKGAKDTKKSVEDGDGDEGEGEDGGGEDGEDGDTGSDQALIDFAKEIGYDDLESLSEAELAVVRKAFEKHGKAMAAGGDDEEFEDALTEFEKEEEDNKDGKNKAKAGSEEEEEEDQTDTGTKGSGYDSNDPRQVFVSILDGKFKPAYKSDSDYYGKLKKAGEEGDLEQYTVLQNQRFIEQFMRFAKPIMDVFVERQLGTFADLITPALSTVSRISSNEKLSTARNQAVSALESAANTKGAKPYAGIKKFLSPDKPDENVVINGRSYPSSPYARTLKKHPEILSIRVEGKDGKPDYTKTFIAQYKHAMRLERQGRASGQSPVPKKSATELVKAGVAAGQRQAKKEAGGKLNSNSSSGGGSGKAGNRDKSWAEKYGTLGQGDGNASWIGS